MKRSLATKLTIALVAVLAVITGFYFYKQNNRPKVSSAAVDTSDWNVYKEGALGLEMKLPPGWTAQTASLGPDTETDSGSAFAADSLGSGYGGYVTPNSSIQFSFETGKTNSTLNDLATKLHLTVGSAEPNKKIIVSGLLAIQNGWTGHDTRQTPPTFSWTSEDVIMVQRNNYFLQLKFDVRSNSKERDEAVNAEWATLLDGLKFSDPVDINVPVDMSNWKTYSEPALGIELKYPADWNGGTGLVGADKGNENPAWRNIDGTAYWDNGTIELSLKMATANISLKDFYDQHGIGSTNNPVNVKINGNDAISDVLRAGDKEIHEETLIKSGNRFAYLDFSFSAPDVTTAYQINAAWQAVKNSLKISPLIK